MIQLELLSGLLDAVDGHAARLLGQSSKFGAMLDMLTDRWQFKVVPLASSYIRCATMCLLTTLSTFYPSFMFLFQVKCLVSFQYLIELFLLNAADHFDFSCQWQLTLPATGSTSTPLSSRFTIPFMNSWQILSKHTLNREPPATSLSTLLATTGCVSTTPTGNLARLSFSIFQFRINRKVLFSMCAGNELFYARWCLINVFKPIAAGASIFPVVTFVGCAASDISRTHGLWIVQGKGSMWKGSYLLGHVLLTNISETKSTSACTWPTSPPARSTCSTSLPLSRSPLQLPSRASLCCRWFKCWHFYLKRRYLY